MDSKEKKEEKEEKEEKEAIDEECPKPIKPENKNEKNISKINKILSDNTVEEKVFDLLFVIDATGSMSSYIRAAKDETENIAKELQNEYKDYNFQYGYIFYRDPVDSPDDFHEIINLTDQVNTLPQQIKKINAYGGGDLPEDWVGAYKLVNEKINWRNGIKVIIHLADAGAHGKEFTLSDKYPEESEKLKIELLKCSQTGIKIFGYVITEDARNSFNQCQNYYRRNGGNYEICEFKIAETYSDSDSDESEKKYKKKCKKKCKRRDRKREELEEISEEECERKCKEKCKKKSKRKAKSISSDSVEDESEEDFEDILEGKKKSSKQKNINSEFRTRVINTVKSALP